MSQEEQISFATSSHGEMDQYLGDQHLPSSAAALLQSPTEVISPQCNACPSPTDGLNSSPSLDTWCYSVLPSLEKTFQVEGISLQLIWRPQCLVALPQITCPSTATTDKTIPIIKTLKTGYHASALAISNLWVEPGKSP